MPGHVFQNTDFLDLIQGIGGGKALEQPADVEMFTTHASVTAKPFFEKRGYQVVQEQQVEKKGILLTNYVMKKGVDSTWRKE